LYKENKLKEGHEKLGEKEFVASLLFVCVFFLRKGGVLVDGGKKESGLDVWGASKE
jgi:hypothetical protein